MTVKIKKWGNSYGVRLPKKILDLLHLKEESQLELEIHNGKLIITPKRTLESMLAQINEKNIHQEIDFGTPQGKELL